MADSSNQRESGGPLAVSVAWGYAFAFVLLLFILMILVPDADGPSPWDPQAFSSGMLELIANFRLLDEMADLSIVKVADVGTGFLTVNLDLIEVSQRRFGWAPFYLSILFVITALLVRGIRHRLLASHFGVGPSVRGILRSFYFGRGVDLFFPYGPGEMATSKALVEAGASEETAGKVVFHNRLFEMTAVCTILIAGFIYLGWGGVLEALVWGVIITIAVISLTRPLGWQTEGARRGGIVYNTWTAIRGPQLVSGLQGMLGTPKFFIGTLALSITALAAEILAFWCIKQAFSSPMDAYMLMKDLTFVPFAIAVAVASLARVVPYTFASLGIYELVLVLMFRVFDQGYLSGATVAFLDSLLINGAWLLFMVLSLWRGDLPSILDTWREYFDSSVEQNLPQGA